MAHSGLGNAKICICLPSKLGYEVLYGKEGKGVGNPGAGVGSGPYVPEDVGQVVHNRHNG